MELLDGESGEREDDDDYDDLLHGGDCNRTARRVQQPAALRCQPSGLACRNDGGSLRRPSRRVRSPRQLPVSAIRISPRCQFGVVVPALNRLTLMTLHENCPLMSADTVTLQLTVASGATPVTFA